MTTTRKPQSAPKARMPKARAMYAYSPEGRTELTGFRRDKNEFYSQPVAVLPFPTAKAAKASVKVANMTQEERVAKLIKEIYYHQKTGTFKDGQLAAVVRVTLSALSFPQAGGGK